jgi:hypothetical protein
MEKIYGKDLYVFIKKLLKDNKENEFTAFSFFRLSKEYSDYIGDEYSCDEVKDACIKMADLGFITLFVDVHDEDSFYVKDNL